MVKGPLVCDICGRPFKFVRIIRVVAKEDSTRIIWCGQCHNEEAHECIPHFVQISARVEGLLSHNAQADGWNEIQEAAVLREYDYYKDDEDFRRCLITDDCTGECKACEYTAKKAAETHKHEPPSPAIHLTVRDGVGLDVALNTLVAASVRGKPLQVSIQEVD